MSKLITKECNIQIAELFKKQFSETADSYYLFIAGHTPFIDDLSPPLPNNSVSELSYNTKSNIIYGRKISADDAVLMATKSVWAANTSYQKYDDSIQDLYDKNFYVVADEASDWHVFKCMNNLNNKSTAKPLLSETSAGDISYIKIADDYQWKYLYSVSAADYNKFSTEKFIPVYQNANVASFAVSGGIETISLENGGANYNSYTSGFFSDFNIGGNNQIFGLQSSASSNSNYYNGCALYINSGKAAGEFRIVNQYIVVGDQKRVVLNAPFSVNLDNTSEYEITPYVEINGDGSGCLARAIISETSNSVSKVEVIERGSGYTYATAIITGNTGYVNVSSNISIVANSAVVRPVISPKGGHGSNVYSELYASNLGISISLEENEAGKLATTNDYRTVGIIKNPLLANVHVGISSANGTFIAGMKVLQETTGASATVNGANSTVVRLKDVQGSLAVGKRIVSNTISANVASITGPLDYFDATTTLTVVMTNQGSFGNGFTLDEGVTQDLATGKVFFANSTTVKLTGTRGVFMSSDISGDVFIQGDTTGAIGKVVAINLPDITKYSGEILYVENMQPVQRSNTQTETIKLILKF